MSAYTYILQAHSMDISACAACTSGGWADIGMPAAHGHHLTLAARALLGWESSNEATPASDIEVVKVGAGFARRQSNSEQFAGLAEKKHLEGPGGDWTRIGKPKRRPRRVVQVDTPPPPGYDNDDMLTCYKVKRCPIQEVHDWNGCDPMLAHGQNVRRNPYDTPYQAKLCSTISSCDGECSFAHTPIEIVFHPELFRTTRCRNTACDKGAFCSFAHSDSLVRAPEFLPSARDSTAHGSYNVMHEGGPALIDTARRGCRSLAGYACHRVLACC